MITGNKIFKKAVKIVSLTIGLTAGLVLLAKFWLDGRYDRWMTDSDRVYAIVSKYSEGEGEEPTLGSNVSGGVAPLLKTYSPDVEVASRLTLTGWGSGIKVFAEGRDEPVEASEAALSDEYWFDIFDTDILAGDPKQILTEIGSAMVSRSFNERAGGDLVGKQIWWDEMPDLKFTVKGIYEDFPLTTSARFDIMISLPSISLIMWDGTMNLFGNDRYMGVVKLRDGASPDELNELILSLEKRMPEYQELLDAGIDFTYAVTPLKDLHLSDSSLRSTRLVILLLGIVLVLVGTLNGHGDAQMFRCGERQHSIADDERGVGGHNRVPAARRPARVFLHAADRSTDVAAGKLHGGAFDHRGTGGGSVGGDTALQRDTGDDLCQCAA